MSISLGGNTNPTGGTRNGIDLSKRATSRTTSARGRLSLNLAEFGYGYLYEDGKRIPPEYLVKITSYRNKCTIVAPLQEAISLNVESLWEPIVPTSILKTIHIATQLGTTAAGVENRGAITSATTRRMWFGTSPISVTLKLKFEAIHDAFTEVIEPGRLLQTMAVPSDPSTGSEGFSYQAATSGFRNAETNSLDIIGGIASSTKEFAKIPALIPPGPSPFVWKNLLGGGQNYFDKNQSDIDESRRGGDFILIEIGTFLTFWNVIVKSSGVSYDIKMGANGLPISATAEVTFETYEMPTAESLLKSYTQISSIPDLTQSDLRGGVLNSSKAKV
jgi:hypothetical protein